MRMHSDFKEHWVTGGFKEKWDICILYYESTGMYNRRSVANARRKKDLYSNVEEYKKSCRKQTMHKASYHAHGMRTQSMMSQALSV